MQRSATRDFVVGLFLLGGMLALAFLSVTVGGASLTRSGGFELFANFDEIGGLKPRAQVAISGVKVGQVHDISLDENYRARVRMDLRSGLELPIDSSASIVTSGVLGDRYVVLQLGGETEILKSGETISFTEPALLLERLIGKLIHNTDVSTE